MLTISILLLLLAAAAALLAWRFRLLPHRSEARARVAQIEKAPVAPPQPMFLPESFEADELEAEDVSWLLARQRSALDKVERTQLQRESAARFEELGDQLDSLESRVQQLQRRMEEWKSALLEREGLRLSYQQLQNDHLDQQYTLESLREEREQLQLELAEARKEALLDYEENERLKKQLALLRSLTREESEGFYGSQGSSGS
ncbi:hypothetical protein [Flaviaesturariibacter terrae]